MSTKLTKLIAGAGALAFTAFAGEAWALGDSTPYLPGVSVGIPIGALPPPGFYASDDNVIFNGGLRNGSGDVVHGVNLNGYLNIPSILWVPTWQPLAGMNATIAFDAVQPYNFVAVSGGAGPGLAGFFNTIVGANVSWNFAPIFVKAGLGLYIQDGDWHTVANHTWTFEPDLAVTWLSNGWNLTVHGVMDFQTEDDRGNFFGLPAHYQSGDVLYIDVTAGKSIGKWSFGVGGNFTQQVNNDHISSTLACNGVTLSSCDTPAIPGLVSKGRQLQQILVGPYLGYNFGPAEVNAKILSGVHAENAFNATFYHIGFSFPF
jgi:hypothetical protein